ASVAGLRIGLSSRPGHRSRIGPADYGRPMVGRVVKHRGDERRNLLGAEYMDIGTVVLARRHPSRSDLWSIDVLDELLLGRCHPSHWRRTHVWCYRWSAPFSTSE